MILMSLALAVQPGEKAPPFTLTDTSGKPVSLSSYAGKTVVIEWFNPGCPFVKYTHGEGPLQTQPGKVAAQGVTWLAINSGAAGLQGHGAAVNKEAASGWGMTYPVLLDEDGTIGKAYGAVTTPHMYVINPQGTVVYAGALDNAPLGKAEGPPVNYVDAALADVAAGRPVATPTAKPYGCSVKYGS